jgi:hypothetical protein
MTRDDVQHGPRPADLDHAQLRELAEAYNGHQDAIMAAQYGIGEQRTPARVRASALDALAIGEQLIKQIEALGQRMTRSRWVSVVEALSFGASLAEVAQALDVDRVDVVEGVTRWADGQHRYAGMTAERHAEVLALLARGAR